MKKEEFHLSIWLIFNFIRISFWFTAAFALLFVIKTILHLFGLAPDFSPNIHLPNKFDVIEKGTLTLSNITASVKIIDATGCIQFDKMPRNVMLFLSFGLIPLFGASMLILWYFKRFLLNVKLGQVFKYENIQYLKKISYVLLAAWVYAKITALIFNFFIINTVAFESIKLQFTIGSSMLLWFSLSIWVLSHVFQKGVEIEEENSLTI